VNLRQFAPDDAHYLELGRIAAGSAMLDGICETLIGVLVGGAADVDAQNRARRLTQGQQTSALTDGLKRLASEGGQCVEELRKWASDVRSVADQRNGVIHAVWLMKLGEHHVGMKRRAKTGTSFEWVTLEDLRGIVKTQDDLCVRGLAVAKALDADPAAVPDDEGV
jgi:hypothetical protein